MKKTLVAIARPICRLIASALWQLLWLLPLSVVYWYSKQALPNMIRSHFGVDQAQAKLSSLEQFAELMKNNSSLTNPTAILHYLSAQLSKFSAATKLSTIEITSNILQTICLWGLNILWILALVYAVIRALRLFRSKSETYETAMVIAKQMHPQLLLLQKEIIALREEIQDLKNANLIDQKPTENQLLTHD